MIYKRKIVVSVLTLMISIVATSALTTEENRGARGEKNATVKIHRNVLYTMPSNNCSKQNTCTDVYSLELAECTAMYPDMTHDYRSCMLGAFRRLQACLVKSIDGTKLIINPDSGGEQEVARGNILEIKMTDVTDAGDLSSVDYVVITDAQGDELLKIPRYLKMKSIRSH